MELQNPTKQLIKNYVGKFEQQNAKSENAIRLLFEKFPENKDFENVLLKSIVINSLYSTRLLAQAIVPVAEHILALNVDQAIQRGDSSIVDKIARVKISDSEQRNNYSFATKYCSFHNLHKYPIYDSFVHRLLMAYKKQSRFAHFTGSELRDYPKFKGILHKFKDFYGLTDIGFRELDMFLWGYGKERFSIK